MSDLRDDEYNLLNKSDYMYLIRFTFVLILMIFGMLSALIILQI